MSRFLCEPLSDSTTTPINFIDENDNSKVDFAYHIVLIVYLDYLQMFYINCVFINNFLQFKR